MCQTRIKCKDQARIKYQGQVRIKYKEHARIKRKGQHRIQYKMQARIIIVENASQDKILGTN